MKKKKKTFLKELSLKQIKHFIGKWKSDFKNEREN